MAEDAKLYGTAVAIGKAGVLITGHSGSGKSDLALRLIDRGATLVSDDIAVVRKKNDRLVLYAAPNIGGKLEVRNVGIMPFKHKEAVRLELVVDLASAAERLPLKQKMQRIMGVQIPAIALNAKEASAPIKVKLALENLALGGGKNG